MHVLTLSVTVGATGRFQDEQTWTGLNPDPRHRRTSLLEAFAAEPTRRSTELYVPIVVEADDRASIPAGLTDGVTVLTALLEDELQSLSISRSAADHIQELLLPGPASVPVLPQPLQVRVLLQGGSDGARPSVAAYEGDEDAKTGLAVLEDLENISIVAAPGSTRGGLTRTAEVAGIQQCSSATARGCGTGSGSSTPPTRRSLARSWSTERRWTPPVLPCTTPG